jgi:uncharacterized membrane protein YhaH (DUF805 family)
MKWYVKVWRQYADFRGRARRKEYWVFVFLNMLFMSIYLFLTFLVAFSTFNTPVIVFMSVILSIYCLAIIIPSFAVMVRRLHDMGNSGWWYLINFIPFIGGFWFLILLCTDSQPGANNWGPNPKDGHQGNHGYRNQNPRETNRYQGAGLPHDKADGYSRPTRLFSQRITVGRSQSNEIRVGEQFDDVSRNHAVIFYEDNSLVFEDHSSCGSYINGRKVHNSRMYIYRNDQIRLGNKYLLSWNEIDRLLQA